MRFTTEVNGTSREADIDPRTLLVDFLRDSLGLTGTHLGCEDGKCGACTVHLDGKDVKSCMLLAVQVNGRRVDTVESLARGTDLSAVQQAFHDEHGLQCGFCTPGFLMAAKALIEVNPEPTEEDVRAHLVGNLCRCTGYTNIVKAVLSAAQALQSGAAVDGNGGSVAPSPGQATEAVPAAAAEREAISHPGQATEGREEAAAGAGNRDTKGD